MTIIRKKKQQMKGNLMPKSKKQKTVRAEIDTSTEKKRPVVVETPAELSLGGILETARKKRKLEIEDVADILRIKGNYLDALEKGRYYAFPARSYAIGFLRNYAKYLRLNPDDLVELFYKETSDTKTEPLDMLVLEKKFPLPSFKTLCEILGIVLAIYIIWYLIAAYLYPEALVSKDKIEVPAPVVEEVALPEPEPVVEEEKKAEPEIAEISEDVFKAPIAFVARERIWVSIKDTDNNKILLDKVLIKNEHYIPKISFSDIAVSTGRAGALDLYLDGKKVKTLGKEQNTDLEDIEDED